MQEFLSLNSLQGNMQGNMQGYMQEFFGQLD
jgi:hypothetical protein